MCKMHRKTVENVLDKRESIRAADIAGTPIGVKCTLRASYPTLDNTATDFIKLTRSESLRVTSSHTKSCGEQSEKRCKIQSISESNGWLQKFLRRSPMQPSFQLHGTGGSSLPVGTDDRMIEIRDVLSQYDPKNIYNMDESGLFYRLGPSRTYLAANESRNDTRGTELQKHERRFSIVMWVNSDGSHILSVSYLGTAMNPNFFGDPRFAPLKGNNWSWPDGWMDCNGFRRWINFWNSEVKKSHMDQCDS